MYTHDARLARAYAIEPTAPCDPGTRNFLVAGASGRRETSKVEVLSFSVSVSLSTQGWKALEIRDDPDEHKLTMIAVRGRDLK